MEDFVDLFEIAVLAETDRVVSRMEKYRVKKTGKNYLPQMLSEELEAQGYSHRMCHRLRVDLLMVVQNPGMYDRAGHVSRCIFCLPEQREKALEKIRADMEAIINQMKEEADKLHARWHGRPFAVEQMKKKEKS